MTVRSVRLPDDLWTALMTGLDRANEGRKRPIILSELIRGLLERGLADPQSLIEIGAKRVRPAHVCTTFAQPAVAEGSSKKAFLVAESDTETSATISHTTAEKLHQARLLSNLPAGKIVDQICRLHEIPPDIKTATRKQLFDNALGNPLAETLSPVAAEAAEKWLSSISSHVK